MPLTTVAKENLEALANNTYGIEIEFGTHDCQMLSFTHIEVCHIYPEGQDPSKGWKIETDADYTFELVSPILKFVTQGWARNFKDWLMRYLEKKVRDGILLNALVSVGEDSLMNVIRNCFEYDPAQGWTEKPTPKLPTLNLDVAWIGVAELQANLKWFNWDEDTDLEKVLAAERILNSPGAGAYLQSTLGSILVTQSRKHGGLPSGQMNLPLSLTNYVQHQMQYKRTKAWERLLAVDSDMGPSIAKAKARLAEMYPDLAGTPGALPWKAK